MVKYPVEMSAPIIITVPNSYLAVEEGETKVFADSSPSRKRKLDHLSWEEKMQRKKLKNRVAAQTSRDRKKAKMDDMESRIHNLEEMNKRLCGEVASLKALNERLLGENETLRSAAARDVSGAPRPAASCPLQKEGLPEALRAARLLLGLMLLSQTSSHTSTPLSISTHSINLQNPCSRKLMQAVQERLKMSQKQGKLSNALKELKWWGPQQSTWNPVEVRS